MNADAIPWYHLNWLDFVFIGIIIFSTAISCFRGFVREAISLMIWGVGIYLAFKFATPLAAHLSALIHLPSLAYIVAFIVIFAAVWLVGVLIQLALRSMLRVIGMGFADRMLGLCFGFVRGVLVVVVALLFIKVSPFEENPSVQTSQLVPRFHVAVDWLDHYAMTFRRQ